MGALDQKVIARWTEKFQVDCRHFNGVQHDACRAGVRYDDVRNVDDATRSRLPCLLLDRSLIRAECKLLSLRTPEEARAKAEETEAAFQAAMDNLAAGKCLTCGVLITRRKTVGRCEYAEPCGHRQGQVASEFDK